MSLCRVLAPEPVPRCSSNPAAPQHPQLMPLSQGTSSPHPSRNLCTRMQTALQPMPAPRSKNRCTFFNHTQRTQQGTTLHLAFPPGAKEHPPRIPPKLLQPALPSPSRTRISSPDAGSAPLLQCWVPAQRPRTPASLCAAAQDSSSSPDPHLRARRSLSGPPRTLRHSA